MDNYQAVLDALTKASSQNAELLKDAERQLKSWETQPGFYSTLLNIVSERNLDINIRWLSVLCAKNGVDSHWRNSISAAEKLFIKQKLLSCMDEPVNQIALQLAVIISRIARQDFPEDWQDLFPTLLSGTQSADELCQQRALLTLHHVIKTLASKRLTYHRRIFEQLTATIFSSIFHLWINFCKHFLEEVQRDISKSKVFLEKSLLSLKILRKLVVYGFKDCSKDADAVNFLSLIFQQFRPFLECRVILQNRDNLLEVCEKYLVLLVKVLRNVSEIQPLAFIQFIQPTLECSVTFCFSKDFQDCLFERLIVQFLNLIKGLLLCAEYKPEKNSVDKDPLLEEVKKIKVEFFTVPVLGEVCQQLISRYFLLSESDIHNWENNPEEFASDEVGESWKYSLRPCTETFFLSLFREFWELLTPLVLEMLKNVQNNPSTDFMSILKKEAVYNAVGLAAFDLYDEVDFDTWFTNILIPELRIKITGYYILRRRVIWLIGQWVGVKMSPDLRPLLYEVVLQLLNNEENLVVRLAAANCLRLAIDDFEFKEDQFLPFLETSLSSLFHLLREVKECDLKMSVLHVLSFIIERMGMEVQPHINSLMQYLPQLWQSCGEHNMLRCAIISCFVQLVKSLHNASESLHSSLLPMIAFCTDVSQPPHVYLLEDGLELWWAILQNTTVSSPELLDLASNLLPLLEFNGETFCVCLQITEAYIVLSRENFLKRYGQNILKTFQSSVNDLKSEGVNKILKVVETALIVFPNDAPILFQPLLQFALKQALLPDELPICLSVYLSLLSRVILHNQSCFVSILQERATELYTDVNSVLKSLFDVWIEKMPLLNPLPKRKLMALALLCLLTSGSEIVHDRICGIYEAVVEVIHDVTKYDSGEDMIMLIHEEEAYQECEIISEHESRMLKLLHLDPVYTVVLKNYFYNQVMALQQTVGTAKFQDLMATVDVDTMQQVSRMFREVKC